MIKNSEIEFFESIKNNCEIIFDIGCREDINYLKISSGKKFYLFEPNPISFTKCRDKIKQFIESLTGNTNRIALYNFGIGNVTDSLDYYQDTQSFFKRHSHVQSNSIGVPLCIKKFSEFLKENNINLIDFLKIDAEGCEPDILLDDVEFIRNNVKYIQFEWASTWFDRDDNINFADIYNAYRDDFNFYFLHDKEHPWKECYTDLLTSIIGQYDFEELNRSIYEGYGLDIIMIKEKDE